MASPHVEHPSSRRPGTYRTDGDGVAFLGRGSRPHVSTTPCFTRIRHCTGRLRGGDNLEDRPLASRMPERYAQPTERHHRRVSVSSKPTGQARQDSHRRLREATRPNRRGRVAWRWGHPPVPTDRPFAALVIVAVSPAVARAGPYHGLEHPGPQASFGSRYRPRPPRVGERTPARSSTRDVRETGSAVSTPCARRCGWFRRRLLLESNPKRLIPDRRS